MTTSTSRTPSRNDIFSTSWSSSDSLVPAPPVQAVSDLIRRRTTGQAWRRPRTIPPRADSIFPSPEPAPKIHFVQQTAGSVREPPELRLRIELADTDITPSPQSSRTSSFFDVSPSTGLSPARHPASPYSTQSISTTSLTGTGSSTNPSLAASLPSPPPTKPLTPIQLRFSPRPELKLGQGRFSQVYLAACRELGVPEGGGWRVCVVKRLEADEDSQALGVREAWFLNQLRGGGGLGGEERGKEYITRLLGVEVEEKEKAPVPIGHAYSHSRSVSDSAAHLLRGALESSHRQRHLSPTSPTHTTSPPRTLLILEHYPLTLSSLISTHTHLLTPHTFPRLASELTSALAYCHTKGILHTDVKSANVLLTTTPTLSVRLADFGSALHLPSLPFGALPTDAAGLGTLSYSAPEFFRPPPSPFGFPADVFSAGVTLGAALFGREPYARLGSARTCRQWVARGAYWAYEERERAEGVEPGPRRSSHSRSSSISDEDDVSPIGPSQFEKVLSRTCSVAELDTYIVPPPKTPIPHQTTTNEVLDMESYADGSPAVYYLGLDGEGRRTRVPQEVLFLLKQMCEPVPEMRPSMAEVARRFEQISDSSDL